MARMVTAVTMMVVPAMSTLAPVLLHSQAMTMEAEISITMNGSKQLMPSGYCNDLISFQEDFHRNILV
jgi:hypothetical protein